MTKQISLGVFLMGTGHHIASWRHSDVPADGAEDVQFFTDIAKIAERGKLDMLFLSDGLSFTHLSHPAELVRFEPFTLLGYLSAVTSRIGLAATASTTYNEPFHLARKFSSLDHMNGGRTGWNVVTSYYEGEAGNFSAAKHLQHELRYERADEFVKVVQGLWDSWEDDALSRNKEAGEYFHPEKLHALNHKGRHFAVRGPLNSSRSPQGQPVLIQAGSSETGIEFAAKFAEVIFTAQQTLEEAQAFYEKVKRKAAEFGRNPDHIKVLPGLSPFVGRTEGEARDEYGGLQELITEEIGLDFLSDYLGGLDFSDYPLDEELPDVIPETNGNQSRRQLIIDLARREKLTVRELYKKVAGSRGHRIVFGSPEQIADQMEEWMDKGAADGFNLMLPVFPKALTQFVDLVVPILQERGRFRTEYEGTTLRSHLGLPVPESRYTGAEAAQ